VPVESLRQLTLRPRGELGSLAYPVLVSEVVALLGVVEVTALPAVDAHAPVVSGRAAPGDRSLLHHLSSRPLLLGPGWQHEVEATEQQFTALDLQLQQAIGEVQRLRHQLELQRHATEQAHARAEAYERSHSWRVTAPARRLWARVRRSAV
jgi:TolA-binding protein